MSASEPQNIRSYSQDDVQKILQMAIARQSDNADREFSYQQLLKLAENDWLAQQSEVQQRKAFDIYRRSKFKKRFGNYAIMNTFLVLVDLIGGGGLGWSLYILLFSGLAIGLDIWNTFQTQGEDYEIAFQKWNRKHQIKQTINTVVNSLVSKWFKAL